MGGAPPTALLKAARRNFVAVPPSATVLEAANAMNRHGVAWVVVMEGGRPVGFLSERSLRLRFLPRNERPDQVRVGDVMQRQIPSVPPSADVKQVARLMVERGITLVAVTRGEKLAGIVHLQDLAELGLNRPALRILDIVSGESQLPDACPSCGFTQFRFRLDSNNLVVKCARCGSTVV